MRRMFLIGVAVFTASSLLCGLAQTPGQLVLARVVQGIGGGLLMPIGRTIALRGARKEDIVGIQALLVWPALFGPVLGPPLGGLLSQWLGWRAALLALTVYAVVTLSLVALRMPETLARRNPQALQPRALVGTWLHVLKSPTFWAFSLQTTATYGGLFTFLAASSFVYIDVLGLTRTQYGWVMASACVAYLAGTLLCRRLLARQGLLRTVAVAGALSVAGGTLMAGVALLGVRQPWALLLPFYLFMLGHGIHQPCGQSGAVGPFPQAAGVASALNGFMMMLAAFGIGAWLGMRLDGTVWPLVNGVWFWSVALALISWTLVQKFGVAREQQA